MFEFLRAFYFDALKYASISAVLHSLFVTKNMKPHFLYYTKNQQDATLAVLFISHCKIILHVSDAFCVHHQEY